MFRVEGEEGVAQVLGLEVADTDGAPFPSLLHLDEGGEIGLAVHRDVHFLDGLLGILGFQVNLVGACERLHGEVVAFLVEGDELVGVHLGLLGVGRGADVHFLCVCHVGPLCLAIVPDGTVGGGGLKLIALDGYLT